MVGYRHDYVEVTESDDNYGQHKATEVHAQDERSGTRISRQVIKRARRKNTFRDVGTPVEDGADSPNNGPYPHKDNHEESSSMGHFLGCRHRSTDDIVTIDGDHGHGVN